MSEGVGPRRCSTGVTGLDAVMLGGFVPQRSYLVRGGPGAGKTTLGLHFLAAGAAVGERSLFITMEESEERIREYALLRGIDVTDVAVLDISPSSAFFVASQSYDIFSPSEVEREPITASIVERIEAHAPERVFIDPMTQFRYLSDNASQFRRQVVSFLRFLRERNATVLFTSERSASVPDDDLQFMSDGVIDIASGAAGRTLAVTKFRGSDFQAGAHTLKLVAAGVEVYPRMQPLARVGDSAFETVSSGVEGVDAILKGGIERGTVTLITGPSGVGKTTLGMQFLQHAASRGERSVLYTFDEDAAMILHRCDGVGMSARTAVAAATLHIRKVEPLRYTADEFDALVRDDVERHGARMVMVDSVAGYTLALRGEDLRPRLHALAKYLQAQDVALIVINEQEAIVGEFRATEMGLSHLADTLVFLRFLEMNGAMRKAIGVLKKRLSDYEKLLREFEITHRGILIGAPLSGLRGILQGTPSFVGDSHLETPS